MARTFLRQDDQIRNSEVYDDSLTPGATLESGAASLEADLNALRAIINVHKKADQTANWYDDLSAPTTFPAEGNVKRGLNDLNEDLHDVERKRFLERFELTADITVPAGQNFVILGSGQIPSLTTVGAVGTTTTIGAVVAAHGGTFGTHSLTEVPCVCAVTPRNMALVVDGSTRDPILSSGRQVYALLQSENATDGHTFGITTPNRLQLSFVRLTAGGDDLEAVPVADIENAVINYTYNERRGFQDLLETALLHMNTVDTPAGASITRQAVYDGQGATPVNITNNAILDLEGPGLAWRIRDDAEANLFSVVEGSAGGTSEVQVNADVDVFNVDAVVNDFASGIRAATGSQRIDVGVNAGVIESQAGNDLRIFGAQELLLDDGNQGGSTWVGTTGVKLSDTSAEWSTYKANFGEVSLLNAINQGANAATRFPKVYANVTANVNADVDVGGVAGGANLDAQLPNLANGDFLEDYDVFVNGVLMRPGANAGANNDYYPGTSLVDGQLKFEFKLKANKDVIAVIPYA